MARILRKIMLWSFLTGIALIFVGVVMTSGAQSNPAGIPVLVVGWTLVVLNFMIALFWVLIQLFNFAEDEVRQYSAWKKTLTPEQRAAVNLAEAAALTGIAVEVHRRHNSPEARAKRQAIQDSIMGRNDPSNQPGYSPFRAQP